MLYSWRNFKISGPLETGDGTLTWVLFGERYDGAIFWSALSVLTHQDFWSRVALVFNTFEKCFSNRQAPSSAYVPFKTVGVWFRDEEGGWYFR